MIDWLQSILDWYMYNVNYWSVLVCMAIESTIIPFPSELIVPPAAWKAANGELNFVLVIVFSTIGAVIGALANYVLACTLGRKFIYSFAESRWGKVCGMTKEKNRKIRTILFEIRQKFHVNRATDSRREKPYLAPGRTRENAVEKFYIIHDSGKRHLESDSRHRRIFSVFPKRTAGNVFHGNNHRDAGRGMLLFRVPNYKEHSKKNKLNTKS